MVNRNKNIHHRYIAFYMCEILVLAYLRSLLFAFHVCSISNTDFELFIKLKGNHLEQRKTKIVFVIGL